MMRKRIKKKLQGLGIFFLIGCCALPCLAACKRQELGAEDILYELKAECAELPQGRVYLSGAEEGEDSFLSPSLIRSLYGEEGEENLARTEEYAIYLSSFAAPYEIAVFQCYSSQDADRIVALCLSRSDEIRVGLRETTYEKLSDCVRIVSKGRYVVMMITEESETLQQKALRLIR